MFSKSWIKKSTESYCESIERLRRAIEEVSTTMLK